MLRTPEQLQHQFKIPAEAGRGRAIPRVLFAYAGPNKSQFLATTIAMIVRSALPEYGGKRSALRSVTQDELAAASGITRPSFTRRLSAISNDRGRTTAQTLERKPKHRVIVNRRQRFATANSYSFGLPSKRDNANPERYVPPSLEQLLEDPAMRERWSAAGLPVDPETGRARCGGFKDVPEWLWDSRLPLSDTARLVMTYYICCGMLDPSKDDKALFGRTEFTVRGVVNPKQQTVANALGISVKSVYLANHDLAEMFLIRVAHDKPIRDAQGNWKRGPAKIIYLPIRQFTMAEAERERQRFKALILRRTGAQEARGQLQEAVSIHQRLLDAWQGSEHALRAFWNECRAQMMRASIAKSLVFELIPQPPG